MIEPQHAGAIYRALHRQSVLVLAFSTVWVRRDPRRDPPTKRAALKLETFVHHKSVYQTIRARRDVDQAFNDYSVWSGVEHCSGEADPRILPLHIFETKGDWSQLGTLAADRDFKRRYGPAPRRVDEGDRRWIKAERRAYHGGDDVVVAGHKLSTGMHWDVSGQRGPLLICSIDEVWSLKAIGRHINVHPDAHVRGTESSRRIWTAGGVGKRK